MMRPVPTVLDELRRAFISTGTKTVTRTDVNKGAYVPTADQRRVLSIAGYEPGLHTDQTTIQIIDSRDGAILETSYYDSQRQDPTRGPETRMGRGLLRIIREGDVLLLGTDGVKVYARIVGNDDAVPLPPLELTAAVEPVFRELDARRLLERAEQSSAAPVATTVTRTEYVRDPAVREYVLRRCGGRCEAPGCDWSGFEKDDGTTFIEVHHITPLAAGGQDTIENTAGICPNCHRRAHYWIDRDELAVALADAVREANAKFKSSM